MKKIQLNKTLVTYLESKKITQQKLSELTEISPSTLHGYLYGVIPKSLENIIQIAHKLDISPPR
ncbi:MAG: hypothetical protein A2381_11335 [Bdellovibrionales bacterium RIFOXYB1_FULL_37_110]|nr:MAG: hypothetical protein A2417_11640 [Bdellovibrionales bacterium RIFOXYC1_FULL_37_79]OFZ57285.1 MAG: hypothetical protein A2381_11335 [Bdellovibrionales bacterium RIFOXYB1_FULL_37_110]OFZ62181.1 MAG: hypothetical protein A2577_13885 [Bdellovibrionales bacterium RIFOXYD1_FULL_36_51]